MTEDAPPDVQATFCATLVDEWVRAGVRHAVVSPGSRSTPLALALAARHEDLDLYVVLDERSAGFCALGVGKATGTPAVLLCTSGTAGANFHPAIVEASESGVPLLVCTADRPPELHDVGSSQTVDQQHLYGRAVRWFVDPGVPDPVGRSSWRSLAARAFSVATDPVRPGPVHLNLPFREPLVAKPGELPKARPGNAPWHDRRVAVTTTRRTILEARRPLVVAGAGAGPRPEEWSELFPGDVPLLADPLSGWRTPGPNVVAAADAVLRHQGFARDHLPDVVVHVGRPWASRVVGEWLAGLDARQVFLAPTWQGTDPSRVGETLVPTLPAINGCDAGWAAAWRQAEAQAQTAIDGVLAAHGRTTEPGVARRLTATLRDGAQVLVASSMPLRDVEWFMAPRAGLTLYANRGANGIDGLTSTALGIALTNPSRPTWALVGDLAFLHDVNGLAAAAAHDVALTIVVLDNSGGGIFSFLPQATQVHPYTFERLFATPQDVDLVEVASAYGVNAHEVERLEQLDEVVANRFARSLRIVVVDVPHRDRNVELHARIHAAVAAALT